MRHRAFYSICRECHWTGYDMGPVKSLSNNQLYQEIRKILYTKATQTIKLSKTFHLMFCTWTKSGSAFAARPYIYSRIIYLYFLGFSFLVTNLDEI